MNLKNFTLIILILCFTSCAEVQNSAGKVLNNAGSVVKSGKGKLFIDPSEEDTDLDRDESDLY
jgi:hypothetical protein